VLADRDGEREVVGDAARERERETEIVAVRDPVLEPDALRVLDPETVPEPELDCEYVLATRALTKKILRDILLTIRDILCKPPTSSPESSFPTRAPFPARLPRLSAGCTTYESKQRIFAQCASFMIGNPSWGNGRLHNNRRIHVRNGEQSSREFLKIFGILKRKVWSIRSSSCRIG